MADAAGRARRHDACFSSTAQEATRPLPWDFSADGGISCRDDDGHRAHEALIKLRACHEPQILYFTLPAILTLAIIATYRRIFAAHRHFQLNAAFAKSWTLLESYNAEYAAAI